ncbi:LysR family transcriptional regulator [Pseudomonas sichuanensis]|uniref:LysR family transcriptional regulator n=1 Tax=Pseudomonas sichuanensis TaxID=2213015 RepID=UPI00244C44CF|nr:LysR family transcriptional regulator [Pseudomonas sichuanensis]MDH0731884.1 LysR family transcriptional regulator [Pseudomonas sichuanensis]MDH1584085.1 LysR family transcriptional regulator [Pseudomonas sichuanensis]MDH1593036.1 LysR family transcriptional regulator [Pseudomonas sichuanensis]MDH1598934.1 LysR family transcriptional regulator [Pseudomonas sichuanensis]
MKLSIRHIEVFRAIMAAGSVTGAARLLFTSQPTVSRELARMEQVTGLNLFDREGGRLTPTAQALLLIDEVERAFVGLERIERFAQAIRNFEQGRLAVTCLPLFSQTLLPRACQRFHQQHRGVSVSITAQESPLLEESLVAQQHDLGLTEVEQVPRGAVGELLFSADMVCVLPQGHPLQAKAVLELSDFDEVDFINLASLDTYRQQLDQHFRAAGVNRRTVIETTSAASVCAMVRQGLGVAIINPLSGLEAGQGGLAIRRLSISVPYRVMLIQPEHRPASAVVDPFCQALREQAREMTVALGGSSAQVTV